MIILLNVMRSLSVNKCINVKGWRGLRNVLVKFKVTVKSPLLIVLTLTYVVRFFIYAIVKTVLKELGKLYL